MKAGSGGPKVGKDSPTGDLGKKAHGEFSRFFGKHIKHKGEHPMPSAELQVRPFQKAGGDNS